MRITQYLEHAGLSENEFRRRVEWSQGLLGKAAKRGSPIGSDKLERVLRTFPDINPEWLLLGSGPMVRNPKEKSTQLVHPTVHPTPSKASGSVRFVPRTPPVVTVGEDGQPNIVMLDAQAAAGLPANYAEPQYFQGLPAFRLPGYRYRNGTLIAIQVMGDSMEPTIGHEDWLIATYLEDPLTQFREGYVHVVVARDGVVAKRLYKAPGGAGFLCRSDNETYPVYELPLSEALQVYKVQAVLSEDLSNGGADIRERLTRLEREMLALKARPKKG